MGERHNPEQLNAEDWGHAVATSEFDHDVPEEREELTIERIEEMINEHQPLFIYFPQNLSKVYGIHVVL